MATKRAFSFRRESNRKVWLSVFLWALRVAGVLVALGALACVGLIIWAYFYLWPLLPPIEQLQNTKLQEPLRIFTREGELIAEFGEKKRRPLAIDQIPLRLRQAYIAAEDDHFYQHPGVDINGLLRASWRLILTGERAQGGSTITMQTVRNFLLSSDRTYLRKLSEIVLALQLERVLTKDQILELYLNKIYLGQRAYGVGAAASLYYGRDVRQLNLAQIAMLAGLPKSPSTKNPIANPKAAIARRNYVLRRMLELDMISNSEYHEARAAKVTASRDSVDIDTPAAHLAESVRSEVTHRFADAYTRGLSVYTTISSFHQWAANRAVHDMLLDYEKRQGYRGPVARLDAETMADPKRLQSALKDTPRVGALVPVAISEIADQSVSVSFADGTNLALDPSAYRWLVKKDKPRAFDIERVLSVGDVVLLEERESVFGIVPAPEIEGALVSLDPNDGAVLAMVGGFDFKRSQFNRAVQAQRQPGSSFKPFIYAAALEQGHTAANILMDTPVVFEDEALEDEWRPRNYSGKFFGPTRFREALVHSRNLSSIRLLQEIGVNYAAEYMERFGFRSNQVPRNLSLALGSGATSPLDMAGGYAVFANGGYRVEPYFIERIEDQAGEVIYRATPDTVCPACELAGSVNAVLAADGFTDTVQVKTDLVPAKRVLDARVAYIMRSVLKDVILRGTGRGARDIGRSDLAGKTGTTNDQQDTWFVGFNGGLVAAAWVGYDDQRSLGARESGGKTALPIWRSYMQTVLQDTDLLEMRRPDGLSSVRIDRGTGLRTNDVSNSMFEVFRIERVPSAVKRASVSNSGRDHTGGVELENLF